MAAFRDEKLRLGLRDTLLNDSKRNHRLAINQLTFNLQPATCPSLTLNSHLAETGPSKILPFSLVSCTGFLLNRKTVSLRTKVFNWRHRFKFYYRFIGALGETLFLSHFLFHLTQRKLCAFHKVTLLKRSDWWILIGDHQDTPQASIKIVIVLQCVFA